MTSDTLVVVDGRLMAYLADEGDTGPLGTDFNGDGDFMDRIAVVVDMVDGFTQSLNVAAADIAIVQDQVFLVVSEDLDSFDWDLDGIPDDLVLLHWSRAAPSLKLVATLSKLGRKHILRADDRIFFVDVPLVPLSPPDTTVSFVTAGMPTVPVRVQNADLANTMDPGLVAIDEGLVFFFQDEEVEGRDLNGDLDLEDDYVLAILDGTDPAAAVRSVGLAVFDDRTPVRARSTAVGDWLVGFLVDEDAQGALNLNDPALFDPAWQPPQCFGLADGDAIDQVLHFLHFAPWNAGPVANPPVNTGLVGRDRVLAVRGSGGTQGYVATMSPEENEGGCSLNNDPDFDPDLGPEVDQDDTMLRWVEARLPVLPVTAVSELIALGPAGGGLQGVTDFGDRFIAVFNEGADQRDHNDDLNFVVQNLLAVLNPNGGQQAEWNFDHSSSVNQFVGANWMQEDRDAGRLLLGIAEIVDGLPLNSGDSDLADTIPTFAFFDPLSPDDLDFPGPPHATQFNNASIVIVGNSGLFRLVEGADNRDANGDGDIADVVLMSVPLNNLDNARPVATLENNTDFGAVSRYFVGDVGAAYISSEFRDRLDLNGDGDLFDFVVRWFRF